MTDRDGLDDPAKPGLGDGLDEAFAALREEAGGGSAAAASTRRRILASAVGRRRRRAVVVRFVLPLAAALAAGTAWGAATGRLPRFVAALSDVFAPARDGGEPSHGAKPPEVPEAPGSAS